MANVIIPYDPELKDYARELRKKATPAEKHLWKFIRRKALGVEFHRQVPMLHFIVDFYCHELKLVLELDGSVHENNEVADGHRQVLIEKYGVRFLRFTNDEVFSNGGVLWPISEMIKEIEEELRRQEERGII